MNIIEEIDFRNIVLLEKYLNGKMDHPELLLFEEKIRKDSRLQEDLELIQEFYRKDNTQRYGKKLFKLKEHYMHRNRLYKRYFLAKRIIAGSIMILSCVLLMLLSALILLRYF